MWMRKWTVKIQEQDKQINLPWSVWVPSINEFAGDLTHPSFLWAMQQVQPLCPLENSKGKGVVSRKSLPGLPSHVTLGFQGALSRCPLSGGNLPRFTGFQSGFNTFYLMTWYKLQKMLQAFPFLKVLMRASLMVQWLRIHLPKQGTWVWFLFQDPTCTGTSKPIGHNYWVHAPRAHAPQEKPQQWEARALQLESSPLFLQLEKVCVQQWRPRAAKKVLIMCLYL